jgi:tetratricopeptide (TPR) repeat protein
MSHVPSRAMTVFLLAGIVAGAPESGQLRAGSQADAAQPSIQDRLNRVRTNLFSRADAVDDAIRELKAILASDPRSAEGHLLLGIAYRMQGAPELLGEAKAELRQALALNPGYVPARYYLAQLYLQVGRAERAKEEMEAALVQAPNHPQFLALLGEAERQLGNPGRSLELNREALKPDESFGEARYYLGLALFDLRQREEAIREFERVVQSGPGVVEPYLSLGTAYLDAGRIDDGMKTLVQASHINPARAEIRIQLARGFRSKGLLEKAEEQLKLAMPEGSATLSAPFAEQVEFEFHQEQGLLRFQQGRLQAAAAIFQKLLDIDPNHGPTNRHLAEVYLAQGSYKLALERAARAEKLGFPLSADKRKQLEAKLRGTQAGKRK